MVSSPDRVRRSVVRTVRRRVRSPFASDATERCIVHVAHHKMGTTWLLGILGDAAHAHGLSFQVQAPSRVAATADVVFFQNIREFTENAPTRPFRGSHMVRDPRDTIVSAYHYHLWTDEQWANVPLDTLGGKTYREHLKSLPKDAGLHAEIERSKWLLDRLAAWDFDDPRFHVMRYELVLADEADEFRRLFASYGFHDDAVTRCLRIVERHSFRAKTSRDVGQVTPNSHLRSGRPGEWREHFTPEHVEHFKQATGDTIVRLGYESSTDWR
jgi:hypothetical protein